MKKCVLKYCLNRDFFICIFFPIFNDNKVRGRFASRRKTRCGEYAKKVSGTGSRVVQDERTGEKM